MPCVEPSSRRRCAPHRSAGAAVQVSQSGWQWGNPTPQGNTLRAIDVSAGAGDAIGDAGTALRHRRRRGRTGSGPATGTVAEPRPASRR